MVELLKQPQYHPFAVTDQVIGIYAATRGHMDKIPPDDVARFESELLAFVKSKYAPLYESIRTAKAISDADREKLEQAVQEFRNAFAATKKAVS